MTVKQFKEFLVNQGISDGARIVISGGVSIDGKGFPDVEITEMTVDGNEVIRLNDFT